MLSLISVTLLAGIAFLCYAIGLTIYRLFFHPLAKIPGPKWAAASRWPEFYYDLIKWPFGQYMFQVDLMHERYGKQVFVTRPEDEALAHSRSDVDT